MASYEQAKSLLGQSVSRRTLYSMTLSDTMTSDRMAKIMDRDQRRYLKLFCTRIYMPNLNLDQLSSIGQRHMGIVRNVPNGPKFGNNVITTEIIENSNYSMYDALRSIFNMVGTNTNPTGARRQQRLRFYKDYVFNIEIKKLEFPDGANSLKESGILDRDEAFDVDDGYKVVATHNFDNCYISEIGQIVYDSTATDDYLTYPVNFTYESYHHSRDKYYME